MYQFNKPSVLSSDKGVQFSELFYSELLLCKIALTYHYNLYVSGMVNHLASLFKLKLQYNSVQKRLFLSMIFIGNKSFKYLNELKVL